MLRIATALALLALTTAISKAETSAPQKPKEQQRIALFNRCAKAQIRSEQLKCQTLYAALYIPK